MLGYVTLGTNDLERAAKFYDAIAAAMGTKRMMEWPGAIAWGEPDGSAGIGLTKPFDGNTASVGNGVMAALAAKSKAQVDEIHAIALANGGTDAGPPGLRPKYDANYYGAFVRDPDGNKIEAVSFLAA